MTNPRQLHEGGVAGLPNAAAALGIDKPVIRMLPMRIVVKARRITCSFLLPIASPPAVSDLQVERAGLPERENSRTWPKHRLRAHGEPAAPGADQNPPPPPAKPPMMSGSWRSTS